MQRSARALRADARIPLIASKIRPLGTFFLSLLSHFHAFAAGSQDFFSCSSPSFPPFLAKANPARQKIFKFNSFKYSKLQNFSITYYLHSTYFYLVKVAH
jgi:hypothetical protein